MLFFFTLIHSFLHISQTFEHWRVSLFEFILFSVYTYSLGDLNKSHVLKNYSAAVDCQIHRSQNYFLDSSCPFGISILMSSEHNKFNIHRNKTPDFHPQTAPPHTQLISGNDNAVNQNSYSTKTFMLAWAPLFLSHSIHHLSGSSRGSSFRMYSASNLFSSPPLLPLWANPQSVTTVTSWPVVSPFLSLPLPRSLFSKSS